MRIFLAGQPSEVRASEVVRGRCPRETEADFTRRPESYWARTLRSIARAADAVPSRPTSRDDRRPSFVALQISSAAAWMFTGTILRRYLLLDTDPSLGVHGITLDPRKEARVVDLHRLKVGQRVADVIR